MPLSLDVFRWEKLILNDPELSFRAKAFALYFGSFMNTHQDVCWPGYRRICYEMNCTPKTISKYVGELVESEYLIIGKHRIFGKGGEQEMNKYIPNIPTKVLSEGNHLIQKVLSDRTKGTSLQDEKVLPHGKHNNNSNNNNNNKRGFSPPTLQMVEQYCRERKNAVDPETFISFYASKGWMVGKTKMKDWKAAVVTWEKRERTAEPKGFQKGKYDGSDAKPGESWEAYQRRKQMEAR